MIVFLFVHGRVLQYPCRFEGYGCVLSLLPAAESLSGVAKRYGVRPAQSVLSRGTRIGQIG